MHDFDWHSVVVATAIARARTERHMLRLSRQRQEETRAERTGIWSLWAWGDCFKRARAMHIDTCRTGEPAEGPRGKGHARKLRFRRHERRTGYRNCRNGRHSFLDAGRRNFPRSQLQHRSITVDTRPGDN